jgi:hypothetical protein
MGHLPESYRFLIALTLTVIILVPAIQYFKKYLQKKENAFIDKVASLMHNIYQGLIITNFDLIPIKSEDFPTLDIGYYDSICSSLKENHFKLVGDFDNSSSVKSDIEFVSFSRIMISENKAIKACFFQMKTKKSSKKMIELSTEFTNGLVLSTSNQIMSAKILYSNGIETSILRTESVDVLLNYHNERIQSKKITGKYLIREVSTINELVEQSKRIRVRENNFRKSMSKEDIIKEIKLFYVALTNEKIISKIADKIINLNNEKELIS